VNTGIGQADVGRTFRRLLPNDLTTELGEIDPSQLTPVFPIDPAWLGIQSKGYQSTTTSIAAGVFDVFDNVLAGWATGGNPVLTPPTTMFDIGNNRLEWLHVRLQGTGTVSPVRVHFAWFPPSVGAFDQLEVDVANPGVVNAGPFFVPAGWQARIRVNQGGAGDQASIDLTGLEAPQGVPLPPFSLSVNVSP